MDRIGPVAVLIILVFTAYILINGVMGFLVGVTPLDHLANANIDCKQEAHQ